MAKTMFVRPLLLAVVVGALATSLLAACLEDPCGSEVSDTECSKKRPGTLGAVDGGYPFQVNK